MTSIATLWLALIAAPGPVSFKADVAPILVAKCLGCHNDRKAANGLNMKTFALLRKGGKAGGSETIVAGDPDASHMVEVLRPDASPRMPLKQAPLSPDEIALVERWIKEGAKFDGSSEAATTLASLVDPLRNLPKVPATVPTADPVTAIAFARDGATLAAASGRSVLLFDAKSGKPLGTLGDHPGPVNAVAIAPDGKTLVACGGRAGQFGSVVVWDLASKSRRRDLRGHADAILAADLAPDGRTLATAGYDRMVRLWDIAEGKELRTLKEHTDAVHAVAFSRDGTKLASGGADRTVKVWDVASGKRVVSLSDSTGEVYAVAFGPSGTMLYAGGADRSIRAWELAGQGGTPVKSVFAHDAAVLRLAVAPDGSSLVSSGEDRAVKSWSLPALRPIAALEPQPDWPQGLAISPDGSRVAVGRYDGSIALLDLATGKPLLALRDAPRPTPPAPKPKPDLVRKATLNAPSPRGATRGGTVRIVLTGQGVGQAAGVHFDDPGLVAAIVPSAKPDPNRLEVDLAINERFPPGLHRFTVQTPLGVPPAQTFVVSEHPEAVEVEPNDDPARGTPGKLPATLVGTIDRPGDVDAWRFDAKAGRTLVFEATAKEMGSKLDAVLTLRDARGAVIARAVATPTSPDAALVAKVTADGPVTLEVSDAQYGGGGGHVYRIDAGERPRITSIFPVGARHGDGQTGRIEGPNLVPEWGQVQFSASGRDRSIGSISPIYLSGMGGFSARVGKSYVVAEGNQTVESEPNDDPARANPIASPGGASGRIGRAGDVDLFRFEAKKGRRVVVELFGRRLGSPIDPVVEVLDAHGRAIPRALLRPVEETTIAFRDHPATTRLIRMTKWDDLAMDDYILAGRELMRLAALPRNPDDDAVFWGLGGERSDSGERMAFLETTPEQHPLGQPLYKVEVHPPGATFPAGGVPPVTLNYRNDDGGPGFGKDARVTFDPPADGPYLARVEDVRGLGGVEFTYHVVVRPPAPDFLASVSADDPDVPRGGAAIVRVDLVRKDGFDDAVDVTAEGLPPGITAAAARVEPGAYTADLLLMADTSAPTFSPPAWRVVARSVPRSSGEAAVRHELDPGGLLGGRITVTPEPDLKITASPGRVAIRPGERAELTLQVTRGPAFAGRVPIEVRNLPRGVRVLNIGLNGVLVTETQASRSISLYAEPWVEAVDRPFFAVGRVEAAAADSSSPPIPLVVLPRMGGPRVEAGSGTSRP